MTKFYTATSNTHEYKPNEHTGTGDLQIIECSKPPIAHLHHIHHNAIVISVCACLPHLCEKEQKAFCSKDNFMANQ